MNITIIVKIEGIRIHKVGHGLDLARVGSR